MCALSRDVTDRKHREAEGAALRRVATLVTRAVAPAGVFDAVAREVGLQMRRDIERLERFERDGTVTVVAAWSRSGADRPAVGIRFSLSGTSVAALVAKRGSPARLGSFEGASEPIARETRRWACARRSGVRQAGSFRGSSDGRRDA
jgi:hypothetical protein